MQSYCLYEVIKEKEGACRPLFLKISDLDTDRYN